MAIDAGLEENGYSPVLEGAHESRIGKWFIALTITDQTQVDALNPKYKNHEKIIRYADAMRNEYLNTVHYIEVYLKSKPATK